MTANKDPNAAAGTTHPAPQDQESGTSLGQAFDNLAAANPTMPALTCGDVTLSRQEVAQRSSAAAAALTGLGVTRDAFVTISLPNSLDFVLLALGVWKAGATPQPVSWRLPAAERDQVVALADPALVIDTETALPELRADLDGTGPAAVPPHGGWPPATSWKAPTSGGSTGTPKLIVDGRPAVSTTTSRLAGLLRLGESDTVLITGPMYHNAVFMAAATALMAGAHVVVMPKFDAAETLKLVERHRVTWLYAVPTMMHRIWRLEAEARDQFDVSSLDTVYHFGAPCAPWLKRAWIEWLGPDVIWELYAGTEAQAATRIDGREWLEKPGSVGRVISGHIKIITPTGETAPPGQLGEVVMRPAAGAATYRYVGSHPSDRDGWDSLGDMGWMDTDGYLFLADRQTDMILSGGANVYPAEVEAALDLHPAVASSCVIGLPDDDLGNRVHAIIEIADSGGNHVSDEDLRAFLETRLVRYKIPRTIERVTSTLRDDAGKLRRGALRKARIETLVAESASAPKE